MFRNLIQKKSKKESEDFGSIIDKMFNKLTLKVSLDEIVKKYSETVDEFILETEKENDLNFVGGKFKMKFLEEDIGVIIECYFQNREKQWIKKHSENKMNIDIVDGLSLQRLKKENEFEFNIEKPKKDF